MTDIAIGVTKVGNPLSRRIALWLATVVAGLVGAAMMYLEWRNFFGVSSELSVPVHMADEGSPVKMWAPWWVPASIVMVLTMLLWRRLALRKQRISLWGSALAMVVVWPTIYIVAITCLEVGAMMQFVPPPSIARILTLMPLILKEGVELAVVLTLMGGVVLLPILWAVLIGIATAATGRIILRIAQWFT